MNNLFVMINTHLFHIIILCVIIKTVKAIASLRIYFVLTFLHLAMVFAFIVIISRGCEIMRKIEITTLQGEVFSFNDVRSIEGVNEGILSFEVGEQATHYFPVSILKTWVIYNSERDRFKKNWNY